MSWKFSSAVNSHLCKRRELRIIGGGHIDASKISTVEDGTRNIGTVECSSCQLRPRKIGVAQVGFVERSTEQTGTSEIRPRQGGPHKIGGLKECPGHIRSTQIAEVETSTVKPA